MTIRITNNIDLSCDGCKNLQNKLDQIVDLAIRYAEQLESLQKELQEKNEAIREATSIIENSDICAYNSDLYKLEKKKRKMA